VADDVTINVGAETAPAERSFARLKNKATDTARSIGTKFAEAGKQIQSSSIVSEAETISALFIQMGGNVSRVASIFTSLIRPVSIVGTAFGSTGIAVLGTVGAMGAAAIGAFKLGSTLVQMGEDSVAAGDRLNKLKLLTGAAADTVATMRDITEAAAVAQDKWTVSVVRAVPAVESLRLASLGVKDAAADLAERVADSHDASNEARDAAGELRTMYSGLPVPILLAGEAHGVFADRGRQAVDELNELQAMQLPFVGPENFRETQEFKVEQAAERQKAAEKAAAEFRRKQDADIQKRIQDAGRLAQARDQLGAIEVSAAMAAATEEEKVELQYRQRLAAIEELSMAVKDNAATQAAVDAAEAARLKGLADIRARNAEQQERAAKQYEAQIDQTVAGLQRIQDQMERINQAMVTGVISTIQSLANSTLTVAQAIAGYALELDQEQLDKRQDRIQRFTDKRKELIEEIGEAETETQEAALRADRRAMTDRIKTAKRREEADVKAARKSWRTLKALQLSQVALNAAAAFGMTMATAAVPPPFNFALAGTSSAAVLAQGAAIAAERPPKFHVGGRTGERPGSGPDEVQTTQLTGERVLSRRQTDQLDRIGGPAALDAMTKGGGQPQQINIYLDSQLIWRGMAPPGASRANIHARRK